MALLHDGFKLGMHERRLRFTNYVEDPQGNSMDIDWTLGMNQLTLLLCLKQLFWQAIQGTVDVNQICMHQ